MPTHFRAVQVGDEISLGIHFQVISAINLQSNALRIRLGSYNKIVFQLPLVAIIKEIDAGIDLVVFDLGEGGNPYVPVLRLAANKVAGLARQFVEALDWRVRICAEQIHLQGNRVSTRPAAIVLFGALFVR